MPAPLASWREGAARSAVLDFVDRVTRAGGADFVPPAARVPVLDMGHDWERIFADGVEG